MVSRFGALARLLLKKGETFQLPRCSVLIYLTGDQGEEDERAERWTNQPTKRAPSAGGRAVGLPAQQQPMDQEDQGERGAQQLPDGTTRERTQQLVSEGRKRSKTDPRLCFENVDTMLI